MRLRERAQQLLDPDVTVQKPIAKKHSMDHSMYVMLIWTIAQSQDQYRTDMCASMLQGT